MNVGCHDGCKRHQTISNRQAEPTITILSYKSYYAIWIELQWLNNVRKRLGCRQLVSFFLTGGFVLSRRLLCMGIMYRGYKFDFKYIKLTTMASTSHRVVRSNVMLCCVMLCFVMLWCVVWYSMILYGMVWCDVVCYGMTWVGMVCHGMYVLREIEPENDHKIIKETDDVNIIMNHSYPSHLGSFIYVCKLCHYLTQYWNIFNWTSENIFQ